ncbi:MAG TPA: hypothetical protein VFF52_02030, partial [Isosphaeraceae bacterium]|nr:hypothetical protein [Isosphaeraceae bacterium]
KYQLEVTATALPAPTTSSPPTTTAGGSTTGGNGQDTAQQLITAVNTSIDQFLTDAASLEIHSPTLLANYGIDQDLIRIGNDMKTGPLLQVFADFQSLGQVAFQEAVETIEYKQPAREALLGNSTVVSDLLTINGDKEQTYALLQALAKATGQHLSTQAQAVMSTGLFAPPANTSGLQNVVSSPTVGQFTSYSSPALSAEYAYYLNDQSNIESEADYYYDNYDYSTYSAGTG